MYFEMLVILCGDGESVTEILEVVVSVPKSGVKLNRCGKKTVYVIGI